MPPLAALTGSSDSQTFRDRFPPKSIPSCHRQRCSEPKVVRFMMFYLGMMQYIVNSINLAEVKLDV